MQKECKRGTYGTSYADNSRTDLPHASYAASGQMNYAKAMLTHCFFSKNTGNSRLGIYSREISTVCQPFYM